MSMDQYSSRDALRSIAGRLSCAALVGLLAICSGVADDGIDLSVTPGTGPGEILLQWVAVGSPFVVYRSTDPAHVMEAANELGQTPGNNWLDQPPAGTSLVFYLVTFPGGACPPGQTLCATGCVDLMTDPNQCGQCGRPCQLPNATPSCSGGVCGIASCNQGFGDCDGDASDGCENDLTAIPNCGGCGVTCNDASACTNDVCAGKACRNVQLNTCLYADPNNMNPDDVLQCGPSGCGACNFATSEPSCPSPDGDGDGLGDAWEQAGGIDYNCDGVLDPNNDVMLPGADARVKDVYLKASAMANSPTEPFPDEHVPSEEAVRRVVAAFGASHLDTPPVRCDAASGPGACPSGFACSAEDFVCLPSCQFDSQCPAGVCAGGVCRLRRLHFSRSEINVIPHADVVFMGPVQPACITGGDPAQGVNFYDLKHDPANFDPKDGLFKHYGVFGHFNSCDSTDTCSSAACAGPAGTRPSYGSSGLSELLGNDFVVTLGASPLSPSDSVRVLQDSGTLLHELGHNLGLNHGGAQCDPSSDPSCTYDPNQPNKVNYLSSMNYRYQFGIPVTESPGSTIPSTDLLKFRTDFSHAALQDLDESCLDEVQGVGPGQPPAYMTDLVTYVDPNFGPVTLYGSTMPGQPIDWRYNGFPFEPCVAVNIDNDPPGGPPSGMHRGTEDWDHVMYAFQCSATYVNGEVPAGAEPQHGRSGPPPETQANGSDQEIVVRVMLRRASGNDEAGGTVSAILFGSSGLSVRAIDPSTLRLAGAAAEKVSYGDSDGDGFDDLTAEYRSPGMIHTAGGWRAELTGKLAGGRPLRGDATLDVDRDGRQERAPR